MPNHHREHVLCLRRPGTQTIFMARQLRGVPRVPHPSPLVQHDTSLIVLVMGYVNRSPRSGWGVGVC